VRTWWTHPAREADYTMASPVENGDIRQDLLEPIILGEAAKRGSRIRFSTEYVSLEQDEHGVTALVRDRVTGHEYRIRATYLVGADGGRSQVAEDVGLPMAGAMDIAGSMNIVFEADLARRATAHAWFGHDDGKVSTQDLARHAPSQLRAGRARVRWRPAWLRPRGRLGDDARWRGVSRSPGPTPRRRSCS
jgi:2-polyprenyl-6-methoxyphenol hydroxylase-like FAD-dependent oxidoreductase